jgi:hypothetical protein
MRKIMSYDSYTLGGNSGGPVAIQKPFPACVGIHTRGSYGLNQGIHYADHMIKYIEKWAIEKDYLESKSIIHTERVMKIIDKVATTKEDKIFLMNNKDKFDSFSEENLEICITMYLKVSKDKKRPLSKSPKFRKSGKMKKEEDRKAKGSVFLLLE